MKNIQKFLNKKGASLLEDGVIGPKSLIAAHKFISAELNKRNFSIPTTGLVYVRTDVVLSDTFDDFVVRYNEGVLDRIAPCSTTAGDYYIFNPITNGGITGTAIALEQQVHNSHKFITNKSWGLLWTKQPYFQQMKNIYIYRDGNKDRVINREIVTYGMYGINLHRGWSGLRNWNCSAGCQIVPDKYWTDLISVFKNGQYYDFTLIECL